MKQSLNNLSLCLLLLMSSVDASEEQVLPITNITFRAGSATELSISTRYEYKDLVRVPDWLIYQQGLKPRVEDISLTVSGVRMSVDISHLLEIYDVQYDTLTIRRGTQEDSTVIRFAFGSPISESNAFLHACLNFVGGKYKSMSVIMPATERKQGKRQLMAVRLDRPSGSDAYSFQEKEFQTLVEAFKFFGVATRSSPQPQSLGSEAQEKVNGDN